jgi:hypothetical protein
VAGEGRRRRRRKEEEEKDRALKTNNHSQRFGKNNTPRRRLNEPTHHERRLQIALDIRGSGLQDRVIDFSQAIASEAIDLVAQPDPRFLQSP